MKLKRYIAAVLGTGGVFENYLVWNIAACRHGDRNIFRRWTVNMADDTVAANYTTFRRCETRDNLQVDTCWTLAIWAEYFYKHLQQQNCIRELNTQWAIFSIHNVFNCLLFSIKWLIEQAKQPIYIMQNQIFN